MKPRGAFNIVEFINPKGSIAYRVTGTKLSGQRVRENFDSELEALGRKQELEIEAQNFVPDKRITTTRLTPEQEAEAERVYAELNGKSLTKAVRFFLENYREPVNKIVIKDALDKFIQAKQAEGCRNATISNLKSRVGLLATRFPDKLVSDILSSHINVVLSRTGIDRTTKDNDRRALSSFFSWCMEDEQGYCMDNPAKKRTRTRRNGDAEEPTVLTLAQVRKLLEAAESFKDGKLVPYIALGLFAGIRPTELARLKWDNIDLAAGTITIGSKMAKLRQRRVVEMVSLTEKDKDGKDIKLPANLIDWLAPHAIKRTPIKDANWRKDFDAVKEAAGLIQRISVDGKERKQIVNTGWTQDVLRHTAISHHFALLKHEGATAEWAGNSPNVVHKYYRGLVRPGESTEFFAIKPGESETRVVEMPVAGATRAA